MLLAGWWLLALPSWGADSTPGAPQVAKATFAGGCFWCMEPPFEKLQGVTSVTSGYTGGDKKNPTYEEVSAGGTGHAEAVEIVYDPSVISYAELLEVFWRNIDPVTANAQFCDHGSQYRSAIYYQDETQHRLAGASKEALEKSKRFDEPIVTEITAASEFYPAEEYHQDYYKKNPIRYKVYRYNCGRDRRLEELWGSDEIKQ
ncbi:MAG TPA: peptide-methionine (S)-S-oxide reductase MsrA [Candidatus Binatia bacterium]|nr:peptide-methionine (S)-S-oxide reductase MsrA [Candidatus Binatia bacterium]